MKNKKFRNFVDKFRRIDKRSTNNQQKNDEKTIIRYVLGSAFAASQCTGRSA